MKRKVVIIDHRDEGFDLEKETLRQENVDFVICECKSEDALIEKIKDAYIVAFTYSYITEKIINQLKNCKMLIRYGVGLEKVDIKAAARRGISVCNTPHPEFDS